MKKESKKYRVYDKSTKQWYEIPEAQYREYDRWRTALRKRMQYRGECFCPRSKWWLCDGNCLDCEFRNNTTVSLDDPLPDGEGTLADYVPDGAPLIEEVLSEKAELDQLFERLQELIRKANSKQDNDAIADEIFRLRDQKSQSEADIRSREETRKRIAELQDFIGSQQSEITEFDESLVRKLIQQITVYDDRFTVRFKSGLEIDFNRYDL